MNIDPKIEMVFFDAGETLLHPHGSWSERSIDILEARGHDVSLEQMRLAWYYGGQHFINAADDGWVFAASTADSEEFWTSMYLLMLDDLGIDDPGAADALYVYFSDPMNYVLFDDAIPTLEALRHRGVRMGIISNFEGWLAKLLDHLGVRDFFEVIAISGDLGIEKPDPRIFLWAMEEAGVTPERTLYVGDNPNFDPQPAHDLGMVGVLLDRHGRWADLDAPYAIVPSLTGLLDLL